MINASLIPAINPSPLPYFQESPLPLQWYAVCTLARHEKRVAVRLASAGVEYFLPLYKSIRRWKDRRVALDLPLFPGYVFVRIALENRREVLRDPSISRFVGFEGLPARIADEEIETLRGSLAAGVYIEPYPYLTVGKRMRIKRGPFAGLNGVVLRKKGRWKIVISLDLIRRAVCTELGAEELQPIL